MRSLARLSVPVAAVLPALAAAQEADPAATGSSAWNWVIGIAALLVVIILALEIFRPSRRVRPSRRGA